MKRLHLLLFFCCYLLCNNFALATTIIPYPDLGEMAMASQAVVMVQAQQNMEITESEVTRYATKLRILKSVKGPLTKGETIIIKNLHLKTSDYERRIWGDLELREGENYLLFLSQNGRGEWQPLMLSFAAFQEYVREGEKVLVPFSLGLEVQLARTINGEPIEPLSVYYKRGLLQHLTEVIHRQKNWDSDSVIAPYPPGSFQAGHRAPPSHCTYISSQPNARWDDFPNPLPVYYANGGDPGCSNEVSQIQGAISSLNGNYAGINLTDGGTHSFTPNCITGSTGNEFFDWVRNNLGGRSITIQFDDPCDEIADLNGCSGVLAFGGMYWFNNTTHRWDNRDWRTATVGYVVINNGTGSCQCPGTDYEIMIQHELTHALGIGHIDPGDGFANMNPTCCNPIQTLDIECLDYTYLQSALPVELLTFSGELSTSKVDLTWSTANELNNDYFILEKKGEQGSFQPLAEIKGAGTTNFTSNYRFMDPAPLYGTNYYRLSQVDLDGKRGAAHTIAVDYTAAMELRVFPNPIRDNILQINYSLEQAGPITFEVYNITGQLLRTETLSVAQRSNFTTLNVADLNPGFYLVKMRKGNRIVTKRFIKN